MHLSISKIISGSLKIYPDPNTHTHTAKSHPQICQGHNRSKGQGKGRKQPTRIRKKAKPNTQLPMATYH